MADFIQNSQVLRWDNTLAGTGIVFNRQNGLGKNVSISVDTNVIATVASLDAYQSINVKDQAGGYAGLDETGKLSTSQINFDTSTFYVDENGILKLTTDRISNPFTASGLDTSGIPTGLMLGTDEATIDEVEINDTIRFTTAISWNETNYEAQTVFMRVASTAGTLADFAVQGAPVTSLDQIEQGVVNKYLTAEQLEKLIRMNFSDIAYTGQLSSTGDDCNLYLTNGVWNVPNASAIANTPQKGQGGILICFQRGTYTSSARIQLYLQAAGTSNPVIPYIRVYNGTAGTWSAWERIIKSTDTATTATNGLMSSADKTKLDGLLTNSENDSRFIINGSTPDQKMCITNNNVIPEDGSLNYIAACGYGSSNNAICSGVTVARKANGSLAVYLQALGKNSSLEVCSKGAATVLGYSAKTMQTTIYGDSINLDGNTVLCNSSPVFTVNMLRGNEYSTYIQPRYYINNKSFTFVGLTYTTSTAKLKSYGNHSIDYSIGYFAELPLTLSLYTRFDLTQTKYNDSQYFIMDDYTTKQFTRKDIGYRVYLRLSSRYLEYKQLYPSISYTYTNRD